MDEFQRNMDAVQRRENIDVGAEQLSRRLNKELNADFVDNPSSSAFYSDKNALPAQYPLLLLTNIGTEFVLNEFKKFIGAGTDVKHPTYLYIQYVNKKAQLLGRVDLNLPLLNTINYYAVNCVYYESKGKTTEIDRAKLIDFSELNPQIDPGENAPIYGMEKIKQPQVKLDLSSYDSILDMLGSDDGKSNMTSENNALPSLLNLNGFRSESDESISENNCAFAPTVESINSTPSDTDEILIENEAESIGAAEWGV